MKWPDSGADGMLSDALETATAREGLRQHLRTPLHRNALYLMMNSAITAALGLVFWVVAARFYSAEDVGLASAIISAMMLLALLSTMGLDYALIRFLPSSGKGSNAMINSCLTIGGLASIIIALIFLAGLGFWSPALLFLREDPVFLCSFIVFAAAFTLSPLLNQTFVAERRADFTLAQGIIHSLVKLALVILLAGFFDAFGIFASWGIGLIVAIGTGIFLFLPRVQAGYRPFLAIRKDVVNEMAHFSFANYVANLSWFLPGYILPIMVLNLLGADLNAYFYIAWAVANLLAMIPRSASLSLFAEGSYDEQRLGIDTWRSLKLTFLILVPAVILVVIIADKLLLLFGGSYSESGTTLLRILALSAFPMAINYIYLSMKRVERKLAPLIELSAFIAIATLGLSYLLLPRMGIDGVGIAWLGSQGVAALVVVISFIVRRFGASPG